MNHQDDDHNNEYSSRNADDHTMEDVSIPEGGGVVAEDGQADQDQEGGGLPCPESFEITPEDQERLESILPPVHQIFVPAVRRRAHTVDVEYGGRDVSSSSSCGEEDDENDDEDVYGPARHYHRSSKCSDDEEDDEDSAASLSSLEGYDLLQSGDEGQRRRLPLQRDRRRISAPAATSDSAGIAVIPSSFFNTAALPQRTNLRFSLSEEGRQRRRQQRQKLVNSRCMRGFLALCVYGILVLQPSTTTLMEAGVPEPFEAQSSLAAMFNSTVAGSSASSRRAQLLQQPTLPIEALPKFHHRLGPSTTARLNALPRHQHPAYHSTMPPNAINSITKTNDAITRRNALPPDPPTIYHKKQRPILSHAHSNQLHQEPLVFGREQKTSFFLGDEPSSSGRGSSGGSEDNHNHRDHFSWDGKSWRNPFWSSSSSSSSSSATLIWFSLVCLLVDTTYREWQHYYWHRRFYYSTDSTLTANDPQTLSAMQRRQRRSLHYRRSPSPEPPRRRFDSY